MALSLKLFVAVWVLSRDISCMHPQGHFLRGTFGKISSRFDLEKNS